MAVKILIDSASDISKEEAKEMGLEFIPIMVSFGDEQYFDGDTLSSGQFYEKLIESDVLPKTSQINPFRWEEKLDEIQGADDEIVVVTMSSKLSGTYEAAKTVGESRKNVYVVDSLNVAAGERILIEYALDLRKKGFSAKEISERLDAKKHQVKIIAVVNTLEYLKKGGRISATVAFAGELLSIKPVVSVVDGEVKILGKAMGSKRSNNLLNTLVQNTGVDFSMPICALWSGLDKTMLEKYINDSSSIWINKLESIPTHIIGCTIGTHVGPGAFGVAFFAEK